MNTCRSTPQTRCCLCDSANIQRSALVAEDYVYGNPGAWTYAHCGQCGAAFQDPPIPDEEISRFYPDTYYTGADLVQGDPGWRGRVKELIARHYYGYRQVPEMRLREVPLWPAVWFLARWAGLARYIDYERGGRVLDVGCGNGRQLNLYRGLGWRTCGVDINLRAVEVCQRNGHEAHAGTVFSPKFAPESFDAVVMWDALEHIARPRETLAECQRILKRGGRIYIGVPNFNSWWARVFQDRWYMFTAPVHYVQYTERGLVAALEGTGFRVQRFWYPLGDVGLAGTFAGLAAKDRRPSRLVWNAAAWATAKIDWVLPRGHIFVVAERVR